jgi:HAUS augmin-like complex subunit 1
MAHLSPSAIFSPSAARQQLATAKDWNYIDGWLTTKFNGKSAPPFERNNDTLKALLALAALNETADEDYELVSKVEARILQELQISEANNTNEGTIKAIETHLTREGQASLDTLSYAGVALNQPFAQITQFARRILELQVTSLNLDQVNERVSLLHQHLNTELAQVTALVHELHGDAYRPSSEFSKQTIDDQRKGKVLVARLQDLSSRVASLSLAGVPSKPTVQDVKVEEERFTELMAIVKTLEAQVKSYCGLPHDTDLARLELEELRIELKRLTKERDGIFEGLVEQQSPKKSKSQRS